MKYNEWIERERRIRVKILKSSPAISKDHVYRICRECGEICLCHEEICPNCNLSGLISRQISGDDFNIEEKIRCKYRFFKLEKQG